MHRSRRSEERELDWYLLENPEHKKIQNWVKELLHLYKRNRCLYELDSSWEGFEWINANDADRSIFSFIRKSKDGKNNMLFVINFTPVETRLQSRSAKAQDISARFR